MENLSKTAAAKGFLVAAATAFCLSSPLVPLQAQGADHYRALITIPNPHSANLLHLRGLGGRGMAHIEIGETCHTLPVRFVAGDFSGEAVQIRQSTPIILELRDAHTVRALLNGQDIVSEDITGLVIHSGLAASTGFVINPGRNFSADIFGVRVSQTPCKSHDASAARADQ